MSGLLVSALQLTAIGMGMTFLSIGALTLGMYAMARLTQDKSAETAVPSSTAFPDASTLGADLQKVKEKVEEDELDGAPSGEGLQASDATWGGDVERTLGERGADDDRRRQAAAAAVAVALAQMQAGMPEQDGVLVSGDAWTAYVRGQHLSRRARHDLRRA